MRTESISRLVFGWARSALDPKCTTHMTSQKKVCVMRANYIRGGCVTILLSDHVTICPRVFRLPQYDSWILRCKRQTDLLQPVYEGRGGSCVFMFNICLCALVYLGCHNMTPGFSGVNDKPTCCGVYEQSVLVFCLQESLQDSIHIRFARPLAHACARLIRDTQVRLLVQYEVRTYGEVYLERGIEI